MKKTKPFRDLYYRSLKKTLLIMRIAIFFLTLGILQVHAIDAYSQKTRLSLDFSDTELIKVLDNIEVESEFFFLYNEKLLDTDRKVTIAANDQLITNILDNLFAGTDIKYSIIDRKIILAPDYLRNVTEMQQRLITGTVTDSQTGEPMPGVNIQIKGTTLGTITNAEGDYILQVPNRNETLVFSFIGYVTQEISLNGRTTLDVGLASELKGLHEVVVIGYGTQSKRKVTSSVSSVDVSDVLRLSSSSITQNLSGRAAGLSAFINNAQPGGTVDLQIRGGATGRSPLIVIDGMPTSDFSPSTVGYFKTTNLDGNLSLINTNDIETIDILKDASATAIYGSKAAGGVILITTKRGKASEEGYFSVELNASAGIQKYYNIPKLLDAVEFMEETNRAIYEQWLYNSRLEVYANVTKPTNWVPPGSYLPYYTENEINKFKSGEKSGTDWVKEISRNGIVQDYNLTISGNQKNTSFHSSFNAHNQKGVIKNNDLKKYSGTINVDQRFGKKIMGGFDLKFSQVNINNIPAAEEDSFVFERSGIYMSALSFDPTLPIYDANGNYQINTRQANIPNPVSYLEIKNTTVMERFLSTAFINYNILPELSLRVQTGIDRSQSDNYGYIPKTHIRGAGYNGLANRGENKNTNYQLQFLINYGKTFGKHNISSTLGTEYMKYNWEGMTIEAANFPFDGVSWYNLSLGANRPLVGSFGGNSELISYFLRVSYDYDYRLFLNANLRVDGSSKFSPLEQYALFPGISIGWDLARESFMGSSNGWLKQLKLRAGYGITGNDNIGTAFTNWYAPGANTMWGTSIISGVRLAGLGNKDLTWEKQEDINFGIDFNLNNRITGTVDVFNRVVSRILGSKSLVTWSPVNSISYNLDAKKQSYGLELTLNSKNIETPDFSWNSMITFTYYRDRWLKRDPSYIFGINESPKQYFEELWYYKSDGLVPVNTTDPLNNIPGTIKLLNVNGYLLDEDGKRVVDENGKPQYSGSPDGKFDAADLQLIGVNTPFTIGLSNTLIYRQLDMSVFTYGVFNQWKVNPIRSRNGAIYGNLVTVGANLPIDIIDRWNSDYLNGTRPSSMQGQTAGGGGYGDFWLEKAWFIRVRDINLGYTIPQGKLKRLRLYCNLTNPFLFTPYTGMDPETDNIAAAYPNQRTFNLGINLSF